MRFRREIHRPLDHDGDGISVRGGVDAVISVNTGENGAVSESSVHQVIVQRSTRSGGGRRVTARKMPTTRRPHDG